MGVKRVREGEEMLLKRSNKSVQCKTDHHQLKIDKVM